MPKKKAKRQFHQRLFCVPATPLPGKASCWSYEGEQLVLDLSAAPELSEPDSALRIEDETLPDRVLVVHCLDGVYRAYSNHCACGGFRIDPVPGEEKIRCCTLMQSTYDYEGNFLTGSAKKPITLYDTTVKGTRLIIHLPSNQP